jgi:DNA-binding transcriptional regulator YiaG
VPGFKPACRQVRGETAPLAKLTNRQVRDLRQNPPTNQSEAARRLGVSPTTINLILHNKVYKDA